MSGNVDEIRKSILRGAINPISGAKESLESGDNGIKPPFVFNAEDFYDGMTRNDALDKTSTKLFNYCRTFDRLDRDNDDILTKNELISGAYEDKKNSAKCVAASGMLALLTAGFNALKKTDMGAILPKAPLINVIGYGIALAGGIYAICTNIKARQAIKTYSAA